ncbi:ROK family protein [Streptococcus merionis]|uniref:ROK family protein n=1 Tax=Streptococcus merionis TaxID=400065 RepID=UPI0026EBE05A|nr:ROK family protein [Streptococcus merionis]
MTLLVCDMGGTAVKYALYHQGELSYQAAFPTPESWEELKEELKGLQEQFSSYQLSGVAFSSPGSVDTKQGIIYGKSAISYIHHFPIQEELSDLFGLPVSIENDANCAALAELHFGVAKDSSSSVFFIIGSGVGGAVAQEKSLLKGENLFGGEFGYMILQDGKTLSHLVSPVHVAKRFALAEGLEGSFTGKDLFALADQGHAHAQQAVEEMYQFLAVGIYNVLMTVNPELVVIGGGISVREELIDKVRSRLRQIILEADATDLQFRLVACQYRNNANLLGAVSHFVSQYGENV